MSDERPAVVVIVRPATPLQTSRQILKWLRWLLPAALLIVSDAPLTGVADVDRVITIDADAVESGPLSVADALTRERTATPGSFTGGR